MSELTKDMILDFFVKKGGVVKNVDLVRHFKKYLQVDDPHLKEVSRESFKEKVMDLASIMMENGEKYLHLRPEYGQLAGNMAAKPPNGRPLDSKLPAQQQERKPQEFLPPASASAAGDSSSRGTRHSVVGSYDKVSSAKPSTLDEFTDQLDAYTSGRVEELPTRPLSIIGAVRSLGANLASRKHTAVCSGHLPTTTYGDSYLTTPTSAPPGATPMDLLGVGMPSAHSRQPSDSGSIGSTGSSARPPASGSPQHQLQPFGYSLISQNHGDGGGGGIALLPPRGRSNTTMSSAGFPHQPMRRIKSPQDIKPRPTSARRSRHIDFHQSDQVGTQSQVTPPLVKKRGPAVAPKPSPSSANALAESAPAEVDDDVVSDEEDSECGIDPIDKEWMICASRCDMDNIHRLIATDQALLNKKDFIFTALHWAAKQGRCDVMGALLMSGALVDIQSGLTPLHLACQAGHDNAITILLDNNSNVNLREHSGKRALDMLHVKVTETIRSPPNTLATFTRPRANSALRRQWSSMEGLANINTLHEGHLPKRLTNPLPPTSPRRLCCHQGWPNVDSAFAGARSKAMRHALLCSQLFCLSNLIQAF
eukprot:Em0200g1a